MLNFVVPIVLGILLEICDGAGTGRGKAERTLTFRHERL